jgi:NAD(P)H-binding
MPLVDGIHAIVDAMRAEGVERYIGMATPSVRDPRDTRSLLGRIVPIMGRTLFPRAWRELLDMSRAVTDSGLDWTVARFTRPTDGARTGTVRAGYLGRDRIGESITRSVPARVVARTSLLLCLAATRSRPSRLHEAAR